MKIFRLAEVPKTKPIQSQSNPIKPNQTQFLKILDNLSIIISALLLTGFDDFLLFEDLAGEVVGKGNLDCQRFFKALDFVGYVECQPVIDSYQCCKPKLSEFIGLNPPLAEQGLAVGLVEVPELNLN